MGNGTRELAEGRARGTWLVVAFALAGCVLGACDGEGSDGGTTSQGQDASVPASNDAGTAPDAADCHATGTCPPPTCADLRASGSCPAHRACRESETGGTCLSECETGYLFNAATGLCDSCDVVQCGPPPTCEAGVAGSIAEECASQHRLCVAESAACGGCVAGYTFDMASGSCVRDCSAFACDPGNHPERDQDACVCKANVCTDGSAVVQNANPFACTTCNITCHPGQGEVALYPVTTTNGSCVCSTIEGYYWSSTHQAGRRCDADLDGWINRSAWDAYSNDDPTISSIARGGCEISRVDRVVLANEYGQQKTIYVCGNGLSESPCTMQDGGWSFIPLVEPDANDNQNVIDATPQVTPAPAGGRRLLARELSAVTKACVAVDADFDGDSIADVRQSQAPRSSTDRADRWSDFAYFVELHTSEYQPPVGTEMAGQFVITERSRTDTRFPMGYAAGAGAYWRECSRQRDARYSPGATVPGFDFAQWTTRLDPIVPAPPIASTPAVGQPPAPHGLADLPLPWSGDWRGMTHHSQFKCVLVDDSAAPPEYAVPSTSFTNGASGYLDFQLCTARPSSFGAPPSFTCAVQAPTGQAVGWAAVRYTDAPITDGTRPLHEIAGCVDESIWSSLSPSICPLDTPKDASGHPVQLPNANNFGELICACDETDPTRHPGMADPVDDAFFDSNCDGVDGNSAAMIFVAIDGNDSAGCGSRDNPCRTINRGINVAALNGYPVAVSEGTYDERVVLVDGISIHGGYSRANGWARSPAYVSRIASSGVNGGPQGNPYVESVFASGIGSATEVDRFVVATASAPAGVASVSVYGIRAINSPGVILRHLNVSSGNGSSGSKGGTGQTGNSGNRGGDASGRGGAGGAGNTVCNNGQANTNTGGGRGGDGGGDNVPGACGGTYGPQAGSAPGYVWWTCSGSAGSSAYSCTDPNATAGGDGYGCGDGGGGSSAGVSTFVGQISNALWTPGAGSGNGAWGAAGYGAAGGGGGGGGDADTCVGGANGGGGGGGGSGGCGGGPGGGGTGGGASIALLAVGSNGLQSVDCQFHSGNGGGGGQGGDGGAGGQGGAGGNGYNDSAAFTTQRSCGGTVFPTSDPRDAARGGNGGRGSSGGRGTGGQGGPGGASFGIVLCNSSIDGSPSASNGAGGGGGAAGWPNGASGRSGNAGGITQSCSMSN